MANRKIVAVAAAFGVAALAGTAYLLSPATKDNVSMALCASPPEDVTASEVMDIALIFALAGKFENIEGYTVDGKPGESVENATTGYTFFALTMREKDGPQTAYMLTDNAQGKSCDITAENYRKYKDRGVTLE